MPKMLKVFVSTTGIWLNASTDTSSVKRLTKHLMKIEKCFFLSAQTIDTCRVAKASDII